MRIYPMAISQSEHDKFPWGRIILFPPQKVLVFVFRFCQFYFDFELLSTSFDSTPGGNTMSAAEHTCAMIAALARWAQHYFLVKSDWKLKSLSPRDQESLDRDM